MKELAYIVAFLGLILPGFAAGRLLAPRTRPLIVLAAAPVLSFGSAYLVGLMANAMRLPALTATVIALVALVAGGAVFEIIRARRRPSLGDQLSGVRGWLRRRTPAESVSLALLVVALALGFALWHRFQAPFLVPPGWDAMHHGYFIRQIIEFNTLDTTVVLAPSPTGSDGVTSFYPLAYNLFIAVLHAVSGLPISLLMITSTTIVAGLALPLGIFALARHLDPRRPLVAGFAALASSLPIYLYWVLEPGRTNAVLGLALVPSVVLIMISDGWRPRWGVLPVAALAVAGLTGLHTSELPMAAAVAVIVMATAAIQERALRGLLRWVGWAAAVAATALIPIVFLEPGILGASSQRSEIFVNVAAHALGLRDAVQRTLTPGADLTVALGGGATSVTPWMWAMLVAVGCLLTVRGRWSRYLGMSLGYAFFALLVFGLLTNRLGPLMILTVPWYQDAGRLWWTLTVLGAIPVGVALAGFSGLVGAGVTRVSDAVRRRRFDGDDLAPLQARHAIVQSVVAGVAGLALVLVTALPPVAAASASIQENKGPVRADSQAAFAYLRDHVPAGERVFDDMRVDGSLWMYNDFGVLPLFGNSPYVGAEPKSWLDRLWLRENLGKIDSNGCVASLLSKYSVSYLYFGERIMTDAFHKVDLEFLRSTPYFTEVFTQDKAHVFTITPPADVPPCTGDITPSTRNAF